MGEKSENFGKMMQNSKQRNVWVATSALALITIVAGVMVSLSGNDVKAPTGINVATTPIVNSVPGASDSARYNELQKIENQDKTAEALTQNKTFVPVLTNENATKIEDPKPTEDKKPEPPKMVEPPKVEVEPPPPPVIEVQPQPIPVVYQPQVEKPRMKYNPEDAALIAYLANMWKYKPSTIETDQGTQKGQQQEVAQTTAQSASASQPYSEQQVLAKAGTIFNAVLETGINSDEPSPVLAKIVSGPFKGSKLIGQMQRVGEKVLVQFSTINMSDADRTYQIGAVAVDPNTSRTALATEVDNHYLQRYGLLLAAAFIKGFGEAMANANTTTTVSPFGSVTSQTGNVSTSDAKKKALGEVGTELANQVKQAVPKEPTIKVAAGTAIGVLIMSDFIKK